MIKLRELNLVGNKISGKIPYELVYIESLESISLNGNQLSGEIPYDLFLMPNLKELYLQENQLSGTLPSVMCQNFNQFEQFGIWDNFICPPYPECIKYTNQTSTESCR